MKKRIKATLLIQHSQTKETMKKSAFLFLAWIFLCTNLTLSAQLGGPVRISNDNETIFKPAVVIPADVDNDGDIDLVTQGSYSKTVVWYENLDGNGTMDEPKVILNSETFSIWYIDMLDIDADGVLDLIGGTVNEIFWMKTTIEATPTFSDLIYLPPASISDIYQLEMNDLNGDDILDMIVVGSDLEIGWFEGKDGKGNFRAYELLVDEGRYEIELADFDNDGDLDIVCPNYEDGEFSLGWFENLTGDAAFGSYQVIDPLIELPRNLQIADFDGDEDTDILLGVSTNISNSHHFFWYENNLNDNEGWTKKVISDTAGFAPPVIYDIDLDGDLDFVTSQEGIRVYENINGLGEFVAGDTLAVFGGNSLTHVDVNNDNIEDIVSVYTTSTQYQEMGLIFFGRADQTFENPIDFLGDADRISSFTDGILEGKDLNGDGVVELVASHTLINRFDWQSFDNSHLKFTNPRIIDEVEAVDMDFADFDGDGDEDVVIARGDIGKNQVIWYEKINGEDNYGSANVLFSEHQSVDQVYAADIDGDEDMDIVLNKPVGDNLGIHWFENLDGQGNFSTYQVIDHYPIDFIQMEDVDLDGDLDIFGFDNLPGGFYWMENNDAVFFDPVLLLQEGNITYLLEDMDGNGWKDVIYINNNVVTLQKNSGGVGTYDAPVNFTGIDLAFNEASLFLRDFDLDGDLDLLVSKTSNFLGAHIYLFENTGGEEIFSDGIIIYDLPQKTSKVAIDDFDGDRDMDLVIHSYNNRTLDFIENFLDKSKIAGNAYLDVNENANFDPDEIVIFPQSVVVNPNALAGFPSGTGFFAFAVDNGSYEVTCNVPSDFGFTTPSTLEVEVNEDSIAQVSYGLMATDEYAGGLITITSAPTRCGFEVPFWIDYQNTGTVAGNVIIDIDLDPLTSFVSADPMPDSIVGHTVYWSHANLAPTHSGQIELLLQMPGVASLGEYLYFSCSMIITSLDGTHSDLNVRGYRPQVDCAYDPNDKLVEPSFPGYKNYTLFGDTLDYTVRFQNTETDTAFLVVIEDYLDRDLDYSTLQVIGASHPYEVTLDEPTGRLVFVFKNILLPDSTTNEAGSHGYFRYRINHLEGLPEFTYIQNHANIFFDFNPPINTNTVENILVNNYPLFVDIHHATCFGSSDGSFNVEYEGPFIDSLQWSTGGSGYSIGDLSQGEYDLTVHFINGTQLDTTFSINQPMAVAIQDPVIVPVLCYGTDDGGIEITVEGGTPDFTFQWDNAVTTANQYDLAPGTYGLTVTDENNCKDSLMVILEVPNEIIIAVDVTDELEQTMNGAISVQVSGGQPPFSYAWGFDPNETESSLSGLNAGNYTVTITDTNGCEEVQTITVDQITDTHEARDKYQFRVSPNPAKGTFKVILEAPDLEHWQINITNSLGQLIRTEQSSSNVNSTRQIDFTLEPGLYQVALLIEGVVVRSQAVVVN